MQAFVIRSHDDHAYNQTAGRPGTQHEDSRLVVYVAQSQITGTATNTLFAMWSA